MIRNDSVNRFMGVWLLWMGEGYLVRGGDQAGGSYGLKWYIVCRGKEEDRNCII